MYRERETERGGIAKRERGQRRASDREATRNPKCQESTKRTQENEKRAKGRRKETEESKTRARKKR